MPSGDVGALVGRSRRGFGLADAAGRFAGGAAPPRPVAAPDERNDPAVPRPVIILAEYCKAEKSKY